MLNQRRSLRHLGGLEEKDEGERKGRKKKPRRSEGEETSEEEKVSTNSSQKQQQTPQQPPPRVHAQRKFASVVGNSSPSVVGVKERRSSVSWAVPASGSSSSSSSNSSSSSKKRPKTEDFLTFLCLRGTHLLPPELDFFNKAAAEEDDSTEEEDKPLLSNSSSSSVQALKRKYAAQRQADVPKRRRDGGVKTRSSTVRSSPRRCTFKSGKIIRKKQPSAATIMAKRKTKIAAKRISRMLSCLAPRGTSNATFLRNMKKKLPEGRSLRKRDVSDEETTDDESARRAKRRNRGKRVAEEMELRSRKRSKVVPKKEAAASSSLNNKSRSRDSSGSSSTASRPVRKKRVSRTDSEDESSREKKGDSAERIIYSPNPEQPSSSNNEQSPEGKVVKEKSLDPPPVLVPKEKKEKKKQKSASNLKELQDRLLQEAKKKISDEERTAAVLSAPPMRRLSMDSSSLAQQRKLLPKSEDSPRPHIPVGVVGAALASSSPRVTLMAASPLVQAPPSNVPLNQPLVINTGGAKTESIPLMLPNNMMVHVRGPSGNVIQLAGLQSVVMPKGGTAFVSRPPTFNPYQPPPPGLLSQSPHTVVCNAGLIPQPVVSSSSNLMLTPRLPATSELHLNKPVVSQPIRICTDVTNTNNQPLVSPGPPLLSPQEQIPNKSPPQVKAPPPLLPSHSSSLSEEEDTPTALKSTTSSTSTPMPPILATPPPSKVVPGPPPVPSNTPPSNESQPSLLQVSTQQPSTEDSPQVSSGKDQQQALKDEARLTNNSKPPCLKGCNRIFSKGSSSKAAPSNTSSFKVENESSPYAFDVNDAKPELNFRTKSSSLSESSAGTKQQKKTLVCKSENEPKRSAAEGDEDSSSDDSSLGNDGGSIPIPPELASQLAAQAAKEPSNNETTYFIPLKNNSGQSFGVAVKLGTEGPAGPNQKVIMKAKLVTQPFDKNSGARILGGKDDESVTISLKNDDEDGSRKKKSIMPSVRDKRKNASDSESEDEQERNRVILRDEPASCLGRIESFERFPKLGQHAHLIEAPIYQPSEKEFEDPMKYIENIRADAEQFGICKIIPPKSFKPECNVDDDMRFTAYNQYVQKMMHRWGPNSKEMAAIRKYLATQNIIIKPHPVVGGLEIDLPALFHAVQSFGGLTEVIQRKKWGKIADYLRVPKGTQDRGNKLDELYCKYLLPYDTLSEVEREELLRLVDEEYDERNKKRIERANNEEEEDFDEEESEEEDNLEEDECVLKGKSTSLSQFFRVARNHMAMVFKNSSLDPEPREVEEEYWKLVTERDCHIQVQQGSIDAGGLEGFGFPTSKMSSCGRHPWNLKILSNNPRSLLRTMGPVMGVTVPTLHVGMLFTTGCWYRDPHGLPWVEYQHSGASKIWYGIPHSHSIAFYTAMKQLVPTFCKNKKIWLPSDTTMVPPNLLVKYGVSVCRLIQEPGQFVIVFPKAYTSNICSGYCVAESVYFAPRDYLSFAEQEFRDIRDSTEPMMFPLQKLILSIATDERSSHKTLILVRKHLEKIRDYEYAKRLQISEMGVKTSERIILRKEKGKEEEEAQEALDQEEEDEYECEACSANLYVSFIYDIKEDLYYCLDHAIDILQKTKFSQRKNFKLLFTHSKDEITTIIKLVNRRIDEEPPGNNSSGEESSEYFSPPKRKILSRIDSEPGLLRKSNPPSTPLLLNKPKAESPKQQQRQTAKRPAVVRKVSSEEDSEEEDELEEEQPKVVRPKVPVKKAAAGKKGGGPSASSSKSSRLVPPTSSSNSKSTSSSSSSGNNRKTKREARQKTGNLASELLDMLLSTSEEESEECDDEESDSDESWK